MDVLLLPLLASVGSQAELSQLGFIEIPIGPKDDTDNTEFLFNNEIYEYHKYDNNTDDTG